MSLFIFLGEDKYILLNTYNLLIFAVMGKNKINQYRKVTTLPADAFTVADYAKHKGYSSTPYIYELWRDRNKKNIGFEIVDFHGINFVLVD